MKYELIQQINSIKDNISELDDAGIAHPLINEIYNSICKIEEILEDEDDDPVGRAFGNEDYD
jgi:hypothetical protein